MTVCVLFVLCMLGVTVHVLSNDARWQNILSTSAATIRQLLNVVLLGSVRTGATTNGNSTATEPKHRSQFPNSSHWRNSLASDEKAFLFYWYLRRRKQRPLLRPILASCLRLSYDRWSGTSSPERRGGKPISPPGHDGRASDPLAWSVGQNPARQKGDAFSRKGGWLEPAARSPASGPLSGAGSAPLAMQANGIIPHKARCLKPPTP
jgi:hypothetical protein